MICLVRFEFTKKFNRSYCVKRSGEFIKKADSTVIASLICLEKKSLCSQKEMANMKVKIPKKILRISKKS